MTIIASFDVGIKNLGLCVFAMDADKSFSILTWKTLSLIDNKMCCFKMKNGNQCKCEARFFDATNCHALCGKHIKTLGHDAAKYSAIKKAKDVNIVDLGINLKKILDVECNMQIHSVLIENQISPIANRMKTIQGMIMQYFIMRDVTQIFMMSSHNKLKIKLDKSPFSEEEKATYKKRKVLGIKLTEHLLSHYDCLESSKCLFVGNKKDDLADAFLQGYYYIHQVI